MTDDASKLFQSLADRARKQRDPWTVFGERLGVTLAWSQVVLILCKLLDVVTWSWWWVWAPMLFLLGAMFLIKLCNNTVKAFR